MAENSQQQPLEDGRGGGGTAAGSEEGIESRSSSDGSSETGAATPATATATAADADVDVDVDADADADASGVDGTTTATAPTTLRSLLGTTPVPWSAFLDLLLLSRSPSSSSPPDLEDVGRARCRIAREVASRDRQGQSLLQRALMETDPPGIPPDAVRAVLDLDPPSASDVDMEGRSSLYYACYYRSVLPIISMLLEAHPEAAKRRSAFGTTPLHVAYRAETARALLEAYPGAVAEADDDGEIPLHGIASWGDAGAAKELIRAGRDAGLCHRRRRRRRRPRGDGDGGGGGGDGGGGGGGGGGGSSGDRTLTRPLCGGALVSCRRGYSPLDRACQLVAAMSEREETAGGSGGTTITDLRRSFILVRTPLLGHQALKPLDDDGMRAWDKLEAIARAAWEGSGAEAGSAPAPATSSFRCLHAVIGLGCPPEIVWHAARLNPDSVRERDEAGRTPLHIAALSMGGRTPVRPRNGDSSDDDRDDGGGGSDSGSSGGGGGDDGGGDDDDPLDEIVDMLLRSRYFGSDRPVRTSDADGRLPLHLAALSGARFRTTSAPFVGRGGGPLERLLRAEPRALEARDGRGMFPFMLAAIGCRGRRCRDGGGGGGAEVDAVYRLLREAPAVLERRGGPSESMVALFGPGVN